MTITCTKAGMFLLIAGLLTCLPVSASAADSVVEKHIVIDKQVVNITGTEVESMTVNGGIPGPTLRFTKGEHARIHVENRMDVATSVHWHGLLLPNRQDGVSYLTTPPILPGTMHTFEFPLQHTGVYWYHSHTGLQEQRGVYGSIIVDPAPADDESGDLEADVEQLVVLSDWTNEDPLDILHWLKKGDHWSGIRKGTLPTIAGAIRNDALGEYVQQAWDRMPPMDISDVYYDAFLANGQQEILVEAKPGDTVRLRLINAGASTYFYLNYAGGPLKIVAADGPRVHPLVKDRLLMAIAETYEVLVTVPAASGRYEFRATAQDGSGHASIFIGSGEQRHAATDIPKPDLYRLHGGHDMSATDVVEKETPEPSMTAMNHQGMNHDATGDNDMAASNDSTIDHSSTDHSSADHGNNDRPMPPYDELRSPVSTAINEDLPVKEFVLTLNGDMERYVWSMNGKILSEADKIRIRKGQRVRFVMINETMMHHPMHLHGHFFRVLRSDGSSPDDLPLKHTVDVAPLGRTVIEFEANEEKDWFFHCHVLYHMKAGMSRIVSYEDSELDPDIAAMQYRLYSDPYYFFGDVTVMSQMSEGEVLLQNTRNTFAVSWENNWGESSSAAGPGETAEYEVFTRYEYYVDRYLRWFIGAETRREHLEIMESHGPASGFHDVELEGTRAVAGAHWLWPLRLESTLWVDEEGEARIKLKRHFQVTLRAQVELEYRYDTLVEEEWAANMEYRFSRDLAARVGYHSEYGAGAGLTWRF